MPDKVVLYTASWCPDCARTVQWLRDNAVAFDQVDVEKDPSARQAAAAANYRKLMLPVVEIDGKPLVRPKESELRHALGLEPARSRTADCIVIGGGCAGLTSALYLAREMLDVIVIEKAAPGGQINTTDRVENYPGFPEGVGGIELGEKLTNQAKRFGAEVIAPLEVSQVRPAQAGFEVVTADGLFSAPAVIVATGSEYRRLEVPRARELTGLGLSYCATCDGPFFRNKDIAIIGGGNTAVDEAAFLTRFARREYVIHRRSHFSAEAISVEKLKSSSKVEILFDTVVTELVGEKKVEGLRIRNVKTDQERVLEIDGVFVFIGRTPNTDFLRGFVDLDDKGFIKAAEHVRTSRDGVFVAGDCKADSAAQVTTAVGDGTLAAFAVRDHLEDMERRTAAAPSSP